MSTLSNEAFKPESLKYQRSLQRVSNHLSQTLERDALVQKTTDQIRIQLRVDRVVLYYFYPQWKGQVTFESLSSPHLSILGSTGADECFNDEYATLYLAGRIRAIQDIETEAIQECHQAFLRSLQVKSNLVVPVLTAKGLWGLLIAHHCQTTRSWSSEDIECMKSGAKTLASAPSIQKS